jgi:hypothetical protein
MALKLPFWGRLGKTRIHFSGKYCVCRFITGSFILFPAFNTTTQQHNNTTTQQHNNTTTQQHNNTTTHRLTAINGLIGMGHLLVALSFVASRG